MAQRREWKWRCTKCGMEYMIAAGELPPEWCTRSYGFAHCGGAEFLKTEESTAEPPANLDAWAAKQQP
jgi:hypothetical protein